MDSFIKKYTAKIGNNFELYEILQKKILGR